ncbi:MULTISPECIES: motility associated factor glycosyltransferase family protein [Aeromonas]|uniref:motility associated factor glycosyltransferase family protein n=1 Tax=Aeromonas TaxID=642 RepID=UPI00259D57FC|nr:6-hydroxymethylpterin diphosphokinase MptE-like protein [Aeromonas rivipollensis]MDM5091830.1 DUF115 domain-containing protein [Aeromonas rivipollensis]
MNIDQSIESLEAEVARLRRQQEQEKAMVEMLPIRFNDNLNAFRRYIPAIYEQFENYQPVRPFRLYCNENGIPNLLWLDDKVSLYGKDPYQEASAQIELVMQRSVIESTRYSNDQDFFNQIHVQYLNKMGELIEEMEGKLTRMKGVPATMPLVMMFGVGLGYQLGFLYERCAIKNLFIFEPDLDLFYASLFTFDWAPLLSFLNEEEMGLHFFIGHDEDTLINDMLDAVHKKGAFWVSNQFAFWHYPSDTIFSLIARVSKEFYLLKTGWGFFDDNLFAIAHSHQHLVERTPFLLKNDGWPQDLSRLPAFVIGNGPSLDTALPFLREHGDQGILIACGSSISALHKQGIKPDIYVAVERTKSSADFLALLKDPDYLKDILFLSVDVIHPECKQYFARTGLGFKPNEPMYAILNGRDGDVQNFSDLRFVNPFVGNAGLSYAVTLGFDDVYLFGIDNGYKNNNQHHSAHSLYYNKQQPIKQLTDIVTAETGFAVDGNFGGTVTTNTLFGLAIYSMEHLLRDNEDVRCFNCSDGAIIKGARPLPVEHIALQVQSLDKKELLDNLYNRLFRPLSITSDEISGLLAIDFFDELVDLMITEWESTQYDRQTFASLMQRQYDYLIYVAGTRQHHVYRVLVGSLNYFFSCFTSLIYAFEDEDMKELLWQPAVDIIIAFLKETKVKYHHVLDHIDTTYYEVLRLFDNAENKNNN